MGGGSDIVTTTAHHLLDISLKKIVTDTAHHLLDISLKKIVTTTAHDLLDISLKRSSLPPPIIYWTFQ